MHVTLPTNDSMQWKPKKDSISRGGAVQALNEPLCSNSSFIDNPERAIVILLKELDGSKYHNIHLCPIHSHEEPESH